MTPKQGASLWDDRRPCDSWSQMKYGSRRVPVENPLHIFGAASGERLVTLLGHQGRDGASTHWHTARLDGGWEEVLSTSTSPRATIV